MCVVDAAESVFEEIPVSSQKDRTGGLSADVLNRDDLTVEVIFFGEGENTGTVTLNKEASASGGEVKAKL